MKYTPIEVDREKLTIMGVKFPDIETLNSTANAIGSNMFEGFEPTPRFIEIYLDYSSNKITNEQLIALIKEKAYIA